MINVKNLINVFKYDKKLIKPYWRGILFSEYYVKKYKKLIRRDGKIFLLEDGKLRTTGKTTSITELCQENKDTYVLVQNRGNKIIYPTNIRERILSISELESFIRGKRDIKVYLDEIHISDYRKIKSDGRLSILGGFVFV